MSLMKSTATAFCGVALVLLLGSAVFAQNKSSQRDRKTGRETGDSETDAGGPRSDFPERPAMEGRRPGGSHGGRGPGRPGGGFGQGPFGGGPDGDRPGGPGGPGGPGMHRHGGPGSGGGPGGPPPGGPGQHGSRTRFGAARWPHRDWESVEQRDPEMFKLLKADADLERRTRELAMQYRLAPDDEKSSIEKQMKETVNEHFQVRQNRRSLELKRLEEELKRLRDSFEERNKAREEIVKKRVSQLLGDAPEF